MTVRVGINGFGRIGRQFFRHTLKNPNVQVVAANDIGDIETAAHLMKYDSNYGILPEEVRVEGDTLVVGEQRVKFVAEKDPASIPWQDLGVDIVLESTGLFRDKKQAIVHIEQGGAKRVLISAPAKNEDITIVPGVNDDQFDADKHYVISMASCTTNCLAPVAKVLDDHFKIVKGLMTTVHSYTNDQRILDLPHKDLRRARAAALNIIPTSTGAAVAVGKVLPHLQGRLDGMAMRVPTPTVSVVDLVAEVEKETDEEQVLDALRQAAAGPMKGILGVEDKPLVSTDFKGDPRSSIVDAPSTMVAGGNLVKVLSWYDNEWGYSARLVDMIEIIARKAL